MKYYKTEKWATLLKRQKRAKNVKKILYKDGSICYTVNKAQMCTN